MFGSVCLTVNLYDARVRVSEGDKGRLSKSERHTDTDTDTHTHTRQRGVRRRGWEVNQRTRTDQPPGSVPKTLCSARTL